MKQKLIDMRNLYQIIILVISLNVQPVLGQWTIQESGSTTHLNGVAFFDSVVGIAVGEVGTILRTADGGLNWDEIGGQGNKFLWRAYFVNESDGWITGTNGTLLYTNDKGLNWAEQNVNSTNYLRAIDQFDEANTWLVGNDGALFFSNDQGDNWIDKSVTFQYDFTDVEFVTDSMGVFVGGNGLIMITEDAANSLTRINVTDKHIVKVYFINDSVGWICGQEGLIYKTTNGGYSWGAQNSGSSEFIQDITFVNANEGWAVGRNGLLIGTLDGGENWDILNSPTSSALLSVDFVDSSIGWAAGDRGTILKYSIISNIEETSDYGLECTINPNPVLDEAIIQFSENIGVIKIMIVNSVGRVLKSKYLVNKDLHSYKFSRNELSSGSYFLYITTDKQQITKQFVIE